MLDDPIVVEVRRIREELAKQYNFDVAVIFKNLRERQKAVGNRLVRRGPEGMSEPTAATGAQKAARR